MSADDSNLISFLKQSLLPFDQLPTVLFCIPAIAGLQKYTFLCMYWLKLYTGGNISKKMVTPPTLYTQETSTTASNTSQNSHNSYNVNHPVQKWLSILNEGLLLGSVKT